MRDTNGWRSVRLVSCLFAYAVLGQAATGQEASGIALSESISVSPFVELSLTYDDNVLLTPEGGEQSDLYADLVGGLSLLRVKEASALNLRLWYQIRKYQQFTHLDENTWSEKFEYVTGHVDYLQLILKQSHGVLTDYEFTQSDISSQYERSRAGQFLLETRTRRYKRVLDDISIGLARDTRHFEMRLSGGYASVAFDTDAVTLYDWREYYIQPRLGFRMSDKTMFNLGGEIGRQDSDNELSSLDYLRVRLGTFWTPSEKTRLDGGLGLQQHRVDVSASDGSSLDTQGVHFDANASWMATRKILLHAFGKNEVLPTSAFVRNTKTVDQAAVGAVYQMTENWSASAGLSYRRDTYTAPVRGVDGLEELIGVQGRLIFESDKQNLRIFLKVRYEEFTSNFQEDYNQLRASIGGTFSL